MTQPAISGAAAGPGAGTGQPLAPWQELKYPSERLFEIVQGLYPDTFGKTFFELPPFIRLGWPSKETWDRVFAAKPGWAGKSWAELKERYPDRRDVLPAEQDLARLVRLWPDQLGEDLVEIELFLREGITINDLTYGSGHQRVPKPVATDLRRIDQAARKAFLDQFIPKVHQDRVLATMSMGGGAGSE